MRSVKMRVGVGVMVILSAAQACIAGEQTDLKLDQGIAAGLIESGELTFDLDQKSKERSTGTVTNALKYFNLTFASQGQLGRFVEVSDSWIQEVPADERADFHIALKDGLGNTRDTHVNLVMLAKPFKEGACIYERLHAVLDLNTAKFLWSSAGLNIDSTVNLEGHNFGFKFKMAADGSLSDVKNEYMKKGDGTEDSEAAAGQVSVKLSCNDAGVEGEIVGS